jgi:acetyl esterase/lipase
LIFIPALPARSCEPDPVAVPSMGLPGADGSNSDPAALTTERWHRPSIRARFVNRALEWTCRFYVRKLTGDLTPEMVAGLARIDELCAKVRAPRGTKLEPVKVADLAGEWVHGVGVDLSRESAILYLHGGGWLFGGLNSHRALTSRISTACGMPALALNYRMVPQVSFHQEIEDCVTAYRWLLDQGIPADRIVIMGDSAGGYLTLATALRARSEGLPPPAALVGLSGVYDMDPTTKAAHPNAAQDSAGFLVGLTWLLEVVLDDLDPVAPEVSPVRADLRGLPPTLLTVSASEIVYPDSEELAALLAASGVSCVLQVWDGQPHVFQLLAPLIPEGQKSIARIGGFVRDSLGNARPC